jgi:internalin A
LTHLDISDNKLRKIPDELGYLVNLTYLNLSKNQLSEVPDTLEMLRYLTDLDLSQNRLKAIPRVLGRHENLKRLYISSNPAMRFPPPEVIDQGTGAILTYLRLQVDENNSVRQWISKLLVVGEGGVGKTSLLRALRGKPFQVQQSSTHGIEIKSLKLVHPTRKRVTMTLNTWDFGGQEIYHATHQFFLTNRSLFLLVFNARLGFEQGKLLYWLKTIRANAPESPVILVATWIDERDADLPLSDLKRQFPQIVHFCGISNKTREGIRVLRESIMKSSAKLPLMGESWPRNWLKFAHIIRNTTAQKVTPQLFWETMSRAGVSEDGQSVLASWLHELGDILFFQNDDNVNDLVILKPQWVTKYISDVLTAEEVIKCNGIFTRQCMDQVWKDLTPSLRNFFLRLMERFDLSYRTLENRDISLVVERLPFEPPEFKLLWEQKLREPNCKQVSMKFQVSEILPGIPTWFIARQHRFTIDQGERRGIHWRTGVLFRDREGRHLGLVQTLRDEKTNADYLHLTVRGPVPHNFFDVLREGLELTLRRYPGLKVTRLLPCPNPTQTDCLHEFDYANLTRRLERTPPRETIECPNCLENISVTQLLFGLHYTTQDAVIEQINEFRVSTQEKLETLQETMLEGFTELRELVQRDILREIRSVQNRIESPCPSVFAFRIDRRPSWQKEVGSRRINLKLYCEYPGCLHPVQEGGFYPVDSPKQWLKTMAPHINRLFSILKYVTPVVGPWVNLSAPIYSDLIKSDLTLTEALIKKLPEIKFSEDDRSFIDLDDRDRKLHKISGAALRTLHEFLKEKDPDQVWGGLTRTTTPEGDVLWLCKEHIKELYPTSTP